MPYRGNNIKNANLSPREIANSRRIAKMYTRENIYVHRIINTRPHLRYQLALQLD